VLADTSINLSGTIQGFLQRRTLARQLFSDSFPLGVDGRRTTFAHPPIPESRVGFVTFDPMN
jgi:hypothetical protein